MSEVKYVEVKRKANVGERIKVIGHSLDNANGVATVIRADRDGTVEYLVNGDRKFGTPYYDGRAYVVLEPVVSAAPTLKFTELLTQFLRDNADEVRKIIGDRASDASNEPVKVADNNVLTRAKVIAQAKADVAELERIGGAHSARLPGDSPFYSEFYTVKYHVNRSKCAVTALVYNRYGDDTSTVQAKNTAKCAPGEVFNADIGKAIAIRRALGLTVPDEYLNAPQPDEKRVWTVVEYKGYRVVLVGSGFKGPYDYSRGNAHVGSIVSQDGAIIDDTDVDYTEVAA